MWNWAFLWLFIVEDSLGQGVGEREVGLPGSSRGELEIPAEQSSLFGWIKNQQIQSAASCLARGMVITYHKCPGPDLLKLMTPEAYTSHSGKPEMTTK